MSKSAGNLGRSGSRRISTGTNGGSSNQADQLLVQLTQLPTDPRTVIDLQGATFGDEAFAKLFFFALEYYGHLSIPLRVINVAPEQFKMLQRLGAETMPMLELHPHPGWE